MTIAIDK
ncbi:hypothetical protein YPPY58_2591, partial [Yersinia pestis PY-58]